MRKRVLFFPLLAAVILLACRSQFEIEKDAEATRVASSGATATALSATIAYLESHPLVATVTPTPRDCIATYNYFGLGICVERETVDLFGTPEAGAGKLATVPESGKEWRWYYDQAGNKIGQLAGGLSLDYEKDSVTGEYIIQIKGWIAQSDLTLEGEVGRTTCSAHTWDHLGGQRLCHAHLWGTSSGLVLGTVPGNFELEVVSGVTTRQITNANGVAALAEGREVILSQAFRLKATNADT